MYFVCGLYSKVDFLYKVLVFKEIVFFFEGLCRRRFVVEVFFSFII